MRGNVRKLAVAGVLSAIAAVMGYVPWLGLIPVPTPAGHATILHLPVVLAGVAEGPVVGLAVGFVFGMLSFFQSTLPLFKDPLVSILPRLFIGVTAAYAFMALRRWNLSVALAAAGLVGTVTNTVLVLGMAVLRGYMPLNAALLVAGVQGVPEAVVAAIFLTVVGLALSRAGFLRMPPKKSNA